MCERKWFYTWDGSSISSFMFQLRQVPDLCDQAHIAGWETEYLNDLQQHMIPELVHGSCTTCHKGGTRSA